MCMGGLLWGYCQGCSSEYLELLRLFVPEADLETMIVPLMGASATVKIIDYCAYVEIKQRYENAEKNPIEAVYQFPLDAKASVCDFWAEIDGKKVIGQIKEKEDAKNVYEDAIASGHGAYLLEEEKPNIFKASVGNLPPGKEVLLTIAYVTELEFEDGKLRFVIPTLPYPPNGTTAPKFEKPTNQESPFKDLVPYGLNINITFDMTSNIKQISSPSHPISFEFGDTPNQARVSLSNSDGTPLNKDFELMVTLATPNQPIARTEVNANGEKVAMVALYPSLDEEAEVFTEMIFLVDSLPEGTLFNIVGFGDNFVKLFPEGSKEYNDKTLEIATEHVNKMEANMGGTEIVKPLSAIFAEKPKEGIPRQIFLLTDGEVRNTQECIDTVRKHAGDTRVFTFGIGTEASKRLVMGMAKAGEGFYELIRGDENLDNKVMLQLNRAMKPALTDVKLDWGGLTVQQTPYQLPLLFSGSRLIVYGYLKDEKEVTVTLSANSVVGPFSASITLNTANVTTGNLIHRLAAKSMIRDLEEGRSYLHMKGPKFGDKSKEVNAQIISLSIKNGIVSSKTAFVAVEKRSEATEGEMRLRKMLMTDEYGADEQPKWRSNTTGATRGTGRGRVGGGRGGFGGGKEYRGLPLSGDYGGLPVSPYGGGGGGKGGLPRSYGGGPGAPPPLSGMPPPPSRPAQSAIPPPAGPPPPPGALPPPSPRSSAPPPPPVTGGGPPRAAAFDSGLQQLRKQSSSAPVPSQSASSRAEAETPELLRQLIKNQRANGSWSLDALKLVKRSITSKDIRAAIPSTSVEINAHIEEIMITAIICAYIAARFAAHKVNWNLVVKKANTWIKKETAKLGIEVDWSAAAATFKF